MRPRYMTATRVAVGEAGRQADALQHLEGGAPSLPRGADAVHLQGKRDDGGDAATRIERGIGVLEDRLDAAGGGGGGGGGGGRPPPLHVALAPPPGAPGTSRPRG